MDISEPISSICLCSEPYQVPSLRPLIAQLNIFIHTHKIHAVGVYPRLNRTCDIACTLIIGVYPKVWLINLPPPDHCLKTNTSSRFLTHSRLSLLPHTSDSARCRTYSQTMRIHTLQSTQAHIHPLSAVSVSVSCKSIGGGKLIVSHTQLSSAQRLHDYLHKYMVLSPSGRTPSRSVLISISGRQSYTATAVAPYPPPRMKFARLAFQ